MTFIRCTPQPITDFAAEIATKMILAYVETIQEVGGDEPELPQIAEFDPQWWQRQIDVHVKWAGDRIPEVAEAKIRNVARCLALRNHCGLGCQINFDTKIPYVCRNYLADTRAWPKTCPKTLKDLLDSLSCPTHYPTVEDENT
jgi:hypothetical protein